MKKNSNTSAKIVLTAYNDVELMVNSLQSGANDFVSKPFNSKNLIKKINQCIDLNNYKKEIEIQYS